MYFSINLLIAAMTKLPRKLSQQDTFKYIHITEQIKSARQTEKFLTELYNNSKFDELIAKLYPKQSEFAKLLSSCSITTSQPFPKMVYKYDLADNLTTLDNQIVTKIYTPIEKLFAKQAVIWKKYLGDADIDDITRKIVNTKAPKKVVDFFQEIVDSVVIEPFGIDNNFDDFEAWATSHMLVTKYPGDLITVEWA